MRDTKPLDKEALSIITYKLSKANINYAEPNFDVKGIDIIVLKEESSELYKSLFVQSKGRDITNLHSEILIKKEYNIEKFICFLYLKVDEDEDDHLFCFFYDDIILWTEYQNNYKLDIPKSATTKDYFIEHKYNQEKAKNIRGQVTITT